ncbi:MAG: methylmalonyl Co-A mutase-associated GTPase MeaB [Bacteroidales bacterium]|nr:methylmalonyl Co-A mutase-associated GTPase MeaB [Bacteroidales bacterium]
MNRKKRNKSALSVSKGVKKLPSVNPHLQKIRRREVTVDEFVEGIVTGDRTLLSRAITLIESNLPDHFEQSQEIINKCLPGAGNSIRIGITGVPGVGKSSFIEVFGLYLIKLGHKIAVLAIDPSSERSKGSILGDKTRMESLASQANVFIRPSPSAGSLGGVARKTRETILLCEAAGYNVILVETVGVGQSEVAVNSMVDFFLLLMLAGAGDELQGMKRGIMEMADMIAITKADGSNTNNALRAADEYRSALHLFRTPESGWTPSVLTCSSVQNSGIAEIWNGIEEYKNFAESNNFFANKRRKQALYWMTETINESLRTHFYGNKTVREKLKKLKEKVLKDRVSSFSAAQEIMNEYFNLKKE